MKRSSTWCLEQLSPRKKYIWAKSSFVEQEYPGHKAFLWSAVQEDFNTIPKYNRSSEVLKYLYFDMGLQIVCDRKTVPTMVLK